MSRTIVRGRDVGEGDLLMVGGRLVRVQRLDAYRHPTIEASARIARYPSPHAFDHLDAITLFDDEPVAVFR
jgi:hypothetical protein